MSDFDPLGMLREYVLEEANAEYPGDDQARMNYIVITWIFKFMEPTDRALLPAGTYPEYPVTPLRGKDDEDDEGRRHGGRPADSRRGRCVRQQ